MLEGIEEPNLSKLSNDILELRYLSRDKQGKLVESPKELFDRIANNIALADLRFEGQDACENSRQVFYDMLSSLHFIPASPILMNAGTPLQQLFSDHAQTVEDSMESIFGTLKRAAIIHQNGSGCGFSFSHIRPKFDTVGGRHRVAFGPITVMKIYEVSFNSIKQSGRRPGANMGVLHITHPDILELISCKKDGLLKNFNISVLITDNFMTAVENDEEISLVNPRTHQVVKKIEAKDIFHSLCTNAWKYGDPGVLFIDRINAKRPVYEDILTTSSCGQLGLTNWEGVPYGHVNLGVMVLDGSLNEEKLRSTVRNAVHFLDNCLEMNHYMFPETEMICKANRKIGLGVLGFADMLIKLGIPYASDECLAIVELIGTILQEESIAASRDLATTRGVFPHFDKSVWKQRNMPVRNASLTAISPTGSTSLVANASPGIEPLFALSYILKTSEGNEILRSHPLFEEAVRAGGGDDEVLRKVAHFGTAQKVVEIPNEVRRLFETARDISSEWHIKVQAAWQRFIDQAISKTINLPKTATVEDVAAVFLSAHKAGCKGITIYRDGSRDDQMVELGREQTKLDSFKG